jgi:hypothetical protein
VTLLEITHTERAGWKRRAAAELARILATHKDLPVIAWTIGTTGATLVGQVNGLQPAAQARETFEAWRLALALAEHNELSSSDSTTHLSAASHHNHVRIGLHATVRDDEREG